MGDAEDLLERPPSFDLARGLEDEAVMPQLRLSIIIPNYNYGDYVGLAIESALAVDWPDVEVIVVDDGSVDQSASVIKSYGDRIVAIFQENATQRVACNVGFERSTGDAVMFLDSDDMVTPAIAKECFAVWGDAVSKVQFQMMRIGPDGEPKNSIFPSYRPLPEPKDVLAWITETTAYPTPPGSGNIYARWFLSKIFPLDKSCGAFSDSSCIVAAPFFGDVVTVPKPLVLYRIHARNDSAVRVHHESFAREITRAIDRFNFSKQFFTPGRSSSHSALYHSMPLLEFRVASLKLLPKNHPLPGDSWLRALADAIRVPFGFPAATYKHRLIVSVWSLLTLLSPKAIAQRLVAIRFRHR